MAMRYTGRLTKWNAERGFGYIVADDGGAELFVHISAFARNSPAPSVGDVFSFEVEPDRDGKKRAVRALRPGPQPVSAPAPTRHITPLHPPRHLRRYEGSGVVVKLISFALLCALAWYGYNAYSTRTATSDVSRPALPAALSSPPAQTTLPSTLAPAPQFSGKLAVPADFKCDGRSYCSQMTSCREATLFLQNCPGMALDGDGDGVPCEQQWCTK